MKKEINGIKFETAKVTSNDERFSGTSFRAAVDEDYEKLRKLFGEPEPHDYKVDAEWRLVFGDGKVASIYNYKDGQSYLGSDGTPTEELRDWHIGGFKKDQEVIVKRICKILGTTKVEMCKF